jgi:DNA-binding CsgD family transcriptional regulator
MTPLPRHLNFGSMTAQRAIQSPILVGRDDVLSRFERALADAAAGRGSALLVAGEAGIGKSRVVGALQRQAKTAGFRIAKGDLTPQDQLVPLASVKDFARSLHPADFGTLGEDVLATERGSGGDSLAARRILVHLIADRIVAAMDRPSVLAFEDVHWADELSLEVIGEIVRLAARRPLLVVASYRPEELPSGSIHREWRARLLTQRLASEVALDRLQPAETAQVATLILGTGLPVPRDVAEAVHARTNGIPLHVEELLAALGDAATDGRAIRDAAVPSTIEDAILARSRRLTEEAQSVARAGAVIGRGFAPDVLAGIMDRSPAELDGPLTELVAAGILHPFQLVDHGYYDFRHQLIRDAIYSSAPPGERRRLHARAAEFGTELIGSSEIHASVHFERAGLRAQAYRAAVAGAEAAAAVTSRFEAFELYRRAVANIPDGLSASELGDLWRAYSNAGFAVDDVPAAESATRNARQFYLQAGRPIDAAIQQGLLASLARRDVRPRSERKALLDQAEAELRALPASTERAAASVFLRFMQVVLELDAVRLEDARALLEECRALLVEATVDAAPGDISTLDLDFSLESTNALSGDPGALSRMLALSRRARDAHYESSGVTNYRITADIAARLMEYPTATIGLGEGLRYSDEIEQSYCRRIMASTSALTEWAVGNWDTAVPIAELELVDRGSRRGTLGSRAALSFVSLGRGDLDRARSLLDTTLAFARPSGEIDLILPSLWGLAEVARLDGDNARAFDHCQEAVELAEPTGERALLVPFVVTGVRAALQGRRPEAAQKWLDRITPMLTRWPDLARPALDHAEGLLRTAAGSTVAARSALESAVRGWDARGRIWEASWARLDLAAALARGNRYGDAAPVLAEVLATARRLGSLPLLRRAEELDRSTRSHAGAQEPWHPLSAREYEVARAIAAGMTNGEIAEQLFVSPKTVSAHVEHILAKLGVARRTEIAAWVAAMSAEPAAVHRG